MRIGGRQVKLNCAHFLHGRIPKKVRSILPEDEGHDVNNARKVITAIAETVVMGAEAAWRARQKIISGESPVGLPLRKKVRIAAKVKVILDELRKTRIAHIISTDVSDIMSRSNRQVETWVCINEGLLRKFKKDPNQRTVRELIGPMKDRTGT